MARFILCKCGKHGRIEVPRGESAAVSTELGSKESALQALASGVEKGYVTKDAAATIFRSVSSAR